jgi:hypothetical protein
MGYNARNDEIRDNITRMRREWEAQLIAVSEISLLSNECFPKGRLIFFDRGVFPSSTYRHHQPLFASLVSQGLGGGPLSPD